MSGALLAASDLRRRIDLGSVSANCSHGSVASRGIASSSPSPPPEQPSVGGSSWSRLDEGERWGILDTFAELPIRSLRVHVWDPGLFEGDHQCRCGHASTVRPRCPPHRVRGRVLTHLIGATGTGGRAYGLGGSAHKRNRATQTETGHAHTACVQSRTTGDSPLMTR